MSPIDDLAARFKAQLASQIISAIAGGLMVVGLARLLDPDGYGLLFLALSVFGVFGLISRLGIARSTGRYVSEFKETDPGQVPFIVRTGVIVTLVMIGLTALTLAVSHRFIAEILGEPTLVPLLLMGILFVGLGTANTFLRKTLQGFEDITVAAILRIVNRSSRLFIAIGLVIIGLGAVGALWGYILSSLLTAILGSIYLYRRLGSFRVVGASYEPGLRRRIMEYAVPITATNTATVLDQRVDTLLIGYFLNPAAVSFYVLGSQIVEFLETPMTALGFTLSPTFGAQKAAGNVGEASRIYEHALVNSMLLYIPVGAGIILIADPAVTLVFGTDYLGAIPILQVFGLYAVLRAVTKITGNGLDYLGRARQRAIARGATAFLNVVLNIVLIPTLGVIGAPIATIITYGIYTAANLYIAGQEFHLRLTFLLNRLALISLVTACMSAVVFVLAQHISGLITLIGVIVVGGLVWGILSMTTGLLEVRKIVSIVA